MKKLALALALSAAAFGAQATNATLVDTDAGAGAKFSYVGTNLGSTFSDDLTFTLASGSDWDASGSVDGLFFGLKFGSVVLGQGVKTLNVKIFNDTYTDSLGSLVLLAGSVDVSFLKTVSAGTYHALISGTTQDTSWLPGKPFYNFSLVAQPVPEPESYAMFLAGLGIMGALVRRRRNNG